MKNLTVEKKLNDYLREGEKVCWHGKTEDFPLMGDDVKNKLLAKWIGTVLIGGGTLILLLRNGREANNALVGGIILIAAMIMISPLLEWRSLLKQQYWITDQRAIFMAQDQSFYAMELSAIDGFKVVKGGAGQDCMVLGSCLFDEVKKQLRWRACHPKTDVQNGGSKDEAMGFIFYCVRNAEGAAAQLRQRSGAKAA